MGLVDIKLFDLHFEPSYTSVLILGRKGGAASSQGLTPKELTIPRDELQENSDIFSLLRWRSRLTPFVGRAVEMASLMKWAESGPRISVRIVSGEGGTGKTRLAAEFGMRLREQGWAAGFQNLRQPDALLVKRQGTLILIDYPEENVDELQAFLSDLALVESEDWIRVLLLSRCSIDFWGETFQISKAAGLLDQQSVCLSAIPDPDISIVFHAAQEWAAEQFGTTPEPVPEPALLEWVALAPENKRPLFLMAAGVHDALHPGQEFVRYRGREVVTALVDRELIRLQGIGEGLGLAPRVLSRVLAIAAMARGLDGSDILSLAERDLGLGLPKPSEVLDVLRPSGLLKEDRIEAPTPDIVAAGLVWIVLNQDGEFSPEWIWVSIQEDLADGRESLGRLSYDAEVALGLGEKRIGSLLTKVIAGDLDRCNLARSAFTESSATYSIGLAEAAIAVSRTLVRASMDDWDRARILSNLSSQLSEVGDRVGALEAIQEVVGLDRRLADLSPARFESKLAGSLTNLSNRLSEVGDRVGALEAVQEAVDLYRRLARGNPTQFNPNLATSLNNLSCHLGEAGSRAEALEAIKEAVVIRRSLAEVNPARFEPDLATSLNNLSGRLGEAGSRAEALKAIQEAVVIRRRLAGVNPARFEPALAISLSNMSIGLSETGDQVGALGAIQEAVDLYRRLADASPARFEPELAGSLTNLSNRLGEAGDQAGALEAIQEAIQLIQPYAREYPGGRYEELYQGLLANWRRRGGRSEDT